MIGTPTQNGTNFRDLLLSTRTLLDRKSERPSPRHTRGGRGFKSELGTRRTFRKGSETSFGSNTAKLNCRKGNQNHISTANNEGAGNR